MISRSYCCLPFNHMNFHPNGNVSLCCVAQMSPPDDGFYRMANGTMCNLNHNTIHETWEESSVVNIRKQMLLGEYPKACQGCYNIEKAGGVSRRQTENRRWGEHRSHNQLEFIDLRLSNTCNLKCMMCFPDSSSSLQTHYSKWAEKLDFVSDNNINQCEFDWFDDETIEQIIKYKSTLKYLYINGGEPFIIDKHWKFLERLVEEDAAKHIQLSYNTNCTVYSDEYTKLWKKFKRVTLGLSVDAVGEKNRFIRFPSKWDEVTENVHKFIQNPALSHVNITCSIQWLNAPFLEEFYDWAMPIVNKHAHGSVNQNFVVFPDYLSLSCAPTEFKTKLLTLYEKSKYKKFILSSTMRSYLAEQSETDFQFKQGIQFLDVVEQTRNIGQWRDIFNYEYR